MSRWFRFYTGATLHPKVLSLRDSEFRTWVELLCLVSKNDLDGWLPEAVIIGKATGKKAATIRQQISKLIATGLIDKEQEKLRLHNWEKHQYKSDVSTERTRRFKAKRNVPNQFQGTPPDTDTDTDTERVVPTEPTRARAARLVWPFDDFWKQYPHKVGKEDARKAFQKIERAQSVAFDDLMLGLMRYSAKTDDRPWCNPATWLRSARWTDEPAREVLNGRTNGQSYGRPQSLSERAHELAEKVREQERGGGIARPDELFRRH